MRCSDSRSCFATPSIERKYFSIVSRLSRWLGRSTLARQTDGVIVQ
jgi:hypothetical protein